MLRRGNTRSGVPGTVKYSSDNSPTPGVFRNQLLGGYVAEYRVKPAVVIQWGAYNWHFAPVCYRLLFLFNDEGDCLAAKLQTGNVHCAED